MRMMSLSSRTIRSSGSIWHDPVKLDRFGCEYFLPLIEETTHEAQSKQTPQRRANCPHFTASRWGPNGGQDLSRNGFIESFHSRFRDECLNQEIFFSIAETRVVVEDYRRLYNGERPHSSLGYKTPDEFAKNLTIQPADTRRTSHPN